MGSLSNMTDHDRMDDRIMIVSANIIYQNISDNYQYYHYS